MMVTDGRHMLHRWLTQQSLAECRKILFAAADNGQLCRVSE